MRITAALTAVVLAFGFAQAADTIAIDTDDIAGVVTSTKGPEAGVWVIAETKDLPTKFARIVVTDDRGRYLIPDLPKANYEVWVRGYRLVDSSHVKGAPGHASEPDRDDRARCARCRAVLPLGLLVLADAGAGEERISRHGRQRHRTSDEDAG